MEQTRHDEMRILGCSTLVDFINSQVNTTVTDRKSNFEFPLFYFLLVLHVYDLYTLALFLRFFYCNFLLIKKKKRRKSNSELQVFLKQPYMRWHDYTTWNGKHYVSGLHQNVRFSINELWWCWKWKIHKFLWTTMRERESFQKIF